MQHMFWHGSEGSEIYCDLKITTELGRNRWDDAIRSVAQAQPFIPQPLFVRTVLVDYGEISMRRMVLTLDPSAGMDKVTIGRLLENEERLRKRIGLF